MTKEELLNILDLEHGSEFTYYENIAELLEGEQPLDVAAVFQLLKEVDMVTFSELVETYFYDIMEFLPDRDVDLYNTFEAVKRYFISLAESFDSDGDESDLVKLAEEIDRFHNYYSMESDCVVNDRIRGTESAKSLRDAISDNRLSNMENGELEFDLGNIKEYIVDEYIISLGELSEDE